MHEAFAGCVERVAEEWEYPGNARPWLISTARFKAIDTLRRRADLMRLKTSSCDISKRNRVRRKGPRRGAALRMDSLEDDRLRLILRAVIHR